MEMLPIDAEAAWHCGDQYRSLAAQDTLIAGNDLWIAATALAHELPLATGNAQECERVRRLAVVGLWAEPRSYMW